MIRFGEPNCTASNCQQQVSWVHFQASAEKVSEQERLNTKGSRKFFWWKGQIFKKGTFLFEKAFVTNANFCVSEKTFVKNLEKIKKNWSEGLFAEFENSL